MVKLDIYNNKHGSCDAQVIRMCDGLIRSRERGVVPVHAVTVTRATIYHPYSNRGKDGTFDGVAPREGLCRLFALLYVVDLPVDIYRDMLCQHASGVLLMLSRRITTAPGIINNKHNSKAVAF